MVADDPRSGQVLVHLKPDQDQQKIEKGYNGDQGQKDKKAIADVAPVKADAKQGQYPQRSQNQSVSLHSLLQRNIHPHDQGFQECLRLCLADLGLRGKL